MYISVYKGQNLAQAYIYQPMDPNGFYILTELHTPKLPYFIFYILINMNTDCILIPQ